MKCIVCKKIVSEDKRVYEDTDWCDSCVKKEGKRHYKFSKTTVPFVYSSLPYYVTYRKQIPSKLRQDILNFKG